MDQKIYSIVKNKDNIIFLSDIRLNSTNQIAGLNDLEKKLSFYGYKLYCIIIHENQVEGWAS